MARDDHQVLVNQPGQQFKTRIPDDLHARIKAAAQANNRSANAELVFRLEASFERSGTLSQEIAAVIEKHVEAEVSARLKQIALRISGGSA